jgi:hypothetical protein
LQVIIEVKDWLKSKGAEIAVLPKIESTNSVMNLNEILAASGPHRPLPLSYPERANLPMCARRSWVRRK